MNMKHRIAGWVILALIIGLVSVPLRSAGQATQIEKNIVDVEITAISGLSDANMQQIEVVSMPGSIMTKLNADGSKSITARNLQLVFERRLGTSKSWSTWMTDFHRCNDRTMRTITAGYRTSQKLFPGMVFQDCIPVRYEIYKASIFFERLTVTFSAATAL